MVLSLKRWKSRTPPGLAAGAARIIKPIHMSHDSRPKLNEAKPHRDQASVAGWSSPVARQAHNLKVTGSNPVPATILICKASPEKSGEALCCPDAGHSGNIDANSPWSSTASVAPTGVRVIVSTSERMISAASSSKTGSARLASDVATFRRQTVQTIGTTSCGPAGGREISHYCGSLSDQTGHI